MSPSAPSDASRTASPVLEPLVFPGDGSCTSLVHRWRTVAATVPGETVAGSPGQAITFAEADRLSDLLALDLAARLGDSADPVALLVSHDARLVVATLAVLKAGRLLVVLDTHLPSERLAQIARLAGVATCLVDAAHADLVAGLGDALPSILPFEAVFEAAATSPLDAGEIARRVDAELTLGASRGGDDGFQIVFTSGSTGVPKGVVQTHASFLNDVQALWEVQHYGPGERVALVLPLAFVAGGLLLFSTVLNGGSVWLLDPRDTGVERLVAFIRENRLRGLHATPHLVRSVVASLADGEILDSLRLVLTLGEGIHSRDVEAIRKHLPAQATFATGFGSSEMVTLSLHEIAGGEAIPEGTIATGRVIAGKELRILREDGTPAGIGETGDIVVVSDYLSGGYWRNDALNAEKFGVDGAGRRFLRQGDLGWLDERGVLHIAGRSDSGVKVRGYLVEPSEIENALRLVDDIAEAVVIPVVRENLPTRLVAYVSPTQGARPPSTAMIRRSLRTRLPEYMVPSDILQLTALPRTERGKVDRQALPEVPAHVANVEEMDQQELAMSTLWQQVLELPELNLDDDFMALGGDSLSAEELLTLVADHFGVEIASTDLLAYPTLREFTQHVTAGRTALPTHPDVVTLNGSATGTPVFCFPGAGALALTYLPLAKHFPEQTFYAFQQHGLEKRGLPDWSIEAMVSRALQLVRIVRPHGPYRLIGHSFGGLVAVETARQLVDAGEEVESLVILDTYLPEERAAEAVAETAAPAGAAAPAPGGFARAQGLASGILQRFAPDGLPRGENVGRQVRAYLAGVVRHRGQRQYDSFFDQAVLLARKYRLRPSATPTVLVVADDNPGGAAAWSRVLSNLEVVTMAAEHTSILREPHVRELAERLAPALADRAPATTVATP